MILVKYQGGISGVYLVCDTFDLITNNKYAKYPGILTVTRSIFVEFDKDVGSLLFDMETRRHFHSNHTCFNECFQN